MKQKRKHIFKKSIFLGLILLQFSCNLEEEFITEKNHLGNNRIRYLYGEEALKKSKKLESKIMTSHRIDVFSRTNIALCTNEGIVDYTKVLEVVDENNNVNYTFKITNHPEDSETVFHNLVLSNENTNDEKVLLLKYESNTPTQSIVNFNGTVTRKSIASATNPCDTSTSDIDFTGNTGSDNGSATPIPGDNIIIVTPPYSSSGNGGNSGNSFSDDFVIYDCNSAGCGFITMDRAAMLAHYAPQGFTAAYYFGRQSSTTNTNPCDPNGNIGIINDSVKKTPCDDFNELSQKTGFTTRMNDLKNNLTGTYEKAFCVRNDANNEFSDVVEGDENGDVNPFKNETLGNTFKTIGTGHNHLQNNSKHIGIFTPEDLGPLLLLDLIATSPDNPYQVTNPEKSFTFVLTNKGYFLMKINDMEKIKAFMNDYGTWTNDEKSNFIKEKFSNKVEYNIMPDSTREEIITGFLRFMADKDLGVDLYEGDKNNYNNVQQLFLVDNGNGNYSFNKLPCQ